MVEKTKKTLKYSRWFPVYRAFKTFLKMPADRTKGPPHIRGAFDLKRVMVVVILALLPSLIYGTYNTGFQVLFQGSPDQEVEFWAAFCLGLKKVAPMIMVSYFVGLGVEFFFAVIRRHDVQEGFLVTGLLIPMIMPVDLPLWILAISVAFAVIIGKEAFGGTGMNVMNPALIARAFAFFSYPSYMSGKDVWVAGAAGSDAISGETILATIAKGEEISYHTADLFFGAIPGSIAETSMLWILVGALVLILTGVGSYKIMLGGFLGAAFIGMGFNALASTPLMAFPWDRHLLVGGLAFALVFMATDPVTAAQTELGKWVYGFLVGGLAIFIRVLNPAYPEGAMLAILVMNVFAPAIDIGVLGRHIKKRERRGQRANKAGGE